MDYINNKTKRLSTRYTTEEELRQQQSSNREPKTKGIKNLSNIQAHKRIHVSLVIIKTQKQCLQNFVFSHTKDNNFIFSRSLDREFVLACPAKIS